MAPEIHEAHRRDRRGRRLPAMIILGVIVIAGATWIGLFGFLGGNAALGTAHDLEERYVCDAEVIDLSFPDISRLSEVYTSDRVLLGKLTERNSQPIAIDDMPDLVLAALLSAEDKDFYEHEGIDFKSIFRAIITNLESSGGPGGSTITQQVVKQNFLSAERSIDRKICEAVVAAELERRYTKDQILEFYANSVFFGSNAYGVRAAAQEYFGKDLDELRIAEAAALFIPVRNPTFYHPRREPDNLLAARNRVIDQMVDNGYISRADAAEAKVEPVAIAPHETFEDLSPQVMIAARRELLRNLDVDYGIGDTANERKRAIFGCPAADTTCAGGGGLKIFVTVDQGLQTEANRILKSWFRSPDGPTGAIAMIENRTGAIRTMASGVEFGDDVAAGQREYDIATQGARQAGSAFKPFTLAAALENGRLDGSPVTLGSYWDRSSPYEYDCGSPCSPEGNIWTVNNANGNTPHDLVTLRAATYRSINTVYARVVEVIGPEQVEDMARRLGVTSPHLRPLPSITLGALGVSPLDMAAGYSTLANYGERKSPYLIERIENAAGEVVYEHQVQSTPVLSPSIAAAVVETMEEVVARGTGTAADIGRPQAGKTGTATNSRDVMFVGFVPQYSTAVWVGFADTTTPLEKITVWDDLAGKERYIERAYGGTLAAPIWKQYMEVVARGLRVEAFPEPPQGTAVYRQTPFTKAPDVSGMSSEEITAAVFAAGLNPEFVDVPSTRPQGSIVGQEPRAGTVLREGRSLLIEVSSGRPPAAPLLTLLGLAEAEVTAALTEFAGETGISLSWKSADLAVVDSSRWGRVIATEPLPGTPVADGDVVTVYIGRAP